MHRFSELFQLKRLIKWVQCYFQNYMFFKKSYRHASMRFKDNDKDVAFFTRQYLVTEIKRGANINSVMTVEIVSVLKHLNPISHEMTPNVRSTIYD